MSVYALKPRFQRLLRPVARRLARIGVTANLVTIGAALGSVAVGIVTGRFPERRAVFLAVPAWFVVRMALNAIDGMLAREFDQKTALGAYLNELGDVISDAALYAPFALVAPFGPEGVGVVVALSIVAEFAGAVGPAVGAARRYEGPMGKSDRAVLFGALGLWIGTSAPMPAWLGWLMPVVAVLLITTVINRVRAGIAEVSHGGSMPR